MVGTRSRTRSRAIRRGTFSTAIFRRIVRAMFCLSIFIGRASPDRAGARPYHALPCRERVPAAATAKESARLTTMFALKAINPI
jgi:hypothetical protein